VGESPVWRQLHLLGQRSVFERLRIGKKVPRPHADKAAPAEQEAWKKGGPKNEPSDHALGRSRGGFGSKQHLLVDGNGLRLARCCCQVRRTSLLNSKPWSIASRLSAASGVHGGLAATRPTTRNESDTGCARTVSAR
jgi:hypothetical protein